MFPTAPYYEQNLCLMFCYIFCGLCFRLSFVWLDVGLCLFLHYFCSHSLGCWEFFVIDSYCAYGINSSTEICTCVYKETKSKKNCMDVFPKHEHIIKLGDSYWLH